ncbi:sensor histidine kinase [Frisingicoccus sp.]|uniref:sensor histidine kinase n=3 Tax=Frisingicoccus sp. TaxID=1918627 RepID=UPI00399B1434
MKMLVEYLKLHRKAIGVYFLFALIFAVIFALWQLPVIPVLYGTVLGIFAAFIVCGRDYARFCKKHIQLQSMVEEIKVTDRHFPDADGQIEMDYQEVIQSLYEEKQKITNHMNYQYTDMIEYYTIWVHQIKTPISAMRLQLQGQESESSRELLEELQRIEQYVEMVLTYLRLDSGSTDYVLKKYDLDAIVRQAVRKYASQFIRKKIRLNYEPLSCEVLTDEKWLLFVIEQILSNALKYTRSGEIFITLEAPKTLCIRDTGIGIAPEDLPRIFEKGFTGYNGRSDKKASGIGLYLCRRICGRLNHKLIVTSKVDVGTEVRIDLDRRALEVE